MVIPLHQLRAVNPSISRTNPSEKYIQIISVDNHEFWFMGFVHYDSAVKHIQELLQPQWHTWGRKTPCNIPKMRFVLINMKRFIFLCQFRRLVCGAVRILWLEVETRSLFTVYVLYMCDFILLSKCEWQLICCFSWTNIHYAFTLWSIHLFYLFI